MQLYTIRGAPNGRKAEAVVAHLGLDLELIDLDVRSGAHKQPAYLAINPNGLVPCLVEDDFRLWESHAIMTYLADRAGAESLYPGDIKARAEVNRWLSWAQTQWARATGPFFVERFLKPVLRGQESDPAALEAATAGWHGVAPILEAQLAASEAFVCGANVTLADFALASMAGFWRRMALPLAPYGAIRAWAERLDQVPGWAETAPPKAPPPAAAGG